jgi:hypothetical protein
LVQTFQWLAKSEWKGRKWDLNDLLASLVLNRHQLFSQTWNERDNTFDLPQLEFLMSQLSLASPMVRWNPFKLLDVDYASSPFSEQPLSPEKLALRCFLLEHLAQQPNKACRAELIERSHGQPPLVFVRSVLARLGEQGSPFERLYFTRFLTEAGDTAGAREELERLKPMLMLNLDYNLAVAELERREHGTISDRQLNTVFALGPLDPRVRRMAVRELERRGELAEALDQLGFIEAQGALSPDDRKQLDELRGKLKEARIAAK